MRIARIVVTIAIAILMMAMPAHAEGETINIRSQDCDGIMVNGGGYTAGQKLLTYARAPKGEGTITEQKSVAVNSDGMMPTTTLKFGGKVPDGTYEAVITPDEPGQQEEVTKSFTVKGCMDTADPGTPDEEGLPFTGPSHAMPTLVLGLALLLAGGLMLRRRTQ